MGVWLLFSVINSIYTLSWVLHTTFDSDLYPDLQVAGPHYGLVTSAEELEALPPASGAGLQRERRDLLRFVLSGTGFTGS